MAERKLNHQADILQDPELAAIRQEISRLLPLREQREQVLPLVDRIIEIAMEPGGQATATNEELYRAFSRWYDEAVKRIASSVEDELLGLSREDLRDDIKDGMIDAIKEYLSRGLGINPQFFTGIQEMELLNIAREAARFFEPKRTLHRESVRETFSPEPHEPPPLKELLEIYSPARNPNE